MSPCRTLSTISCTSRRSPRSSSRSSMTGWSRLRKRSALVCQSTCLSSAAGREKRRGRVLESDIRKVYFHFLSGEKRSSRPWKVNMMKTVKKCWVYFTPKSTVLLCFLYAQYIYFNVFVIWPRHFCEIDLEIFLLHIFRSSPLYLNTVNKIRGYIAKDLP